MIFFEKIQEHRIGTDTRDKSRGKGRAAVVAQVAESKQGPRQHGHRFNPARNFDDLPHKQPDGNKQHQPCQRPQQSGDNLGGVQFLNQHQGAQNNDQ